jgi:hypothetical protein
MKQRCSIAEVSQQNRAGGAGEWKLKAGGR